jgi:hypothetical protein
MEKNMLLRRPMRCSSYFSDSPITSTERSRPARFVALSRRYFTLHAFIRSLTRQILCLKSTKIPPTPFPKPSPHSP